MALEDTMDAGVVIGAAQRARSAQAGQNSVPLEMSMKVIPQVIKVLLLHDLRVHNCWRRAGEINPAKVAPDSVKMFQHLGSKNGRRNSEPKSAEKVRVGGFRRVNRRQFAFPAGVEARNRKVKKSQVFRRDV